MTIYLFWEKTALAHGALGESTKALAGGTQILKITAIDKRSAFGGWEPLRFFNAFQGVARFDEMAEARITGNKQPLGKC